MSVLPSRFYGDPSDVVDQLRNARIDEARWQLQQQRQKENRIRNLTRQAMKGKPR